MSNHESNDRSNPRGYRHVPPGYAAESYASCKLDNYDRLLSYSATEAVVRINAGQVSYPALVRAALNEPNKFAAYLDNGLDMSDYERGPRSDLVHETYTQAKLHDWDTVAQALGYFEKGGFRPAFDDFGSAIQILDEAKFVALVSYLLPRQDRVTLISRLTDAVFAANLSRHDAIMSSALPCEVLKEYLNAIAVKLSPLDSLRILLPHLSRFD